MRRFIVSLAWCAVVLNVGVVAWGQDAERPRGGQLYSTPAPSYGYNGSGSLSSRDVPDESAYARPLEKIAPYRPYDPMNFEFLRPHRRGPLEELPGDAVLSPLTTTRYRVYDPYAYVGGSSMVRPAVRWTFYPR